MSFFSNKRYHYHKCYHYQNGGNKLKKENISKKRDYVSKKRNGIFKKAQYIKKGPNLAKLEESENVLLESFTLEIDRMFRTKTRKIRRIKNDESFLQRLSSTHSKRQILYICTQIFNGKENILREKNLFSVILTQFI